MIENIKNLLDFVVSNFRLNDFFDILLVTCIIYYISKFLTAKPQRPTLIFLISLAIITATARIFDLYLISSIIKILFTIILIMIAIVFQSDIRRFVEQSVSKIFYNNPRHSSNFQDIDTIIESISNLAEKNIGAIFVFVGRSYLGNNISGGIKLHADVQTDLVECLFDPKTPSHDGAMIIENKKIVSFGGHLPLSKNTKQVKSLGTRHSAALGLAEKTDAFVIVVSEERGSISIAQNSKLTYNVSITEAKDRLEKFSTPPQKKLKKKSSLIDFIKQNFLLKVSSAFFAILAWLVIIYEPGISFTRIDLPVEFRNLNSDLLINKISNDQVKVSLSGPSNLINNLKNSRNKILLDFKNAKHGSKIFYSSDYQLDLPKGITIHKFAPNIITADVTNFSPVEVPILLNVKGSIPDNYKIIQTNIIPENKKILIPIDFDIEGFYVETQTILLKDISPRNNKVKSKISLPKTFRLAKDESLYVDVEFILGKNED